MSHLPFQSQMDQVSSWGVQDVINYLNQNRLQEFAKYFRENRIDGYHFANLSKTEIQNMQTPKISNTKKRDLWRVVNGVQGKKSAPTHPQQSVPADVTRKAQPDKFDQQKDFDDSSDNDSEWDSSDFDDEEDDGDTKDYENENFKQMPKKKQQQRYEYEGSNNNEMTHSEEDYIPVLQDEECPPPIPSRRNQPGRPNVSARLSPVPAHKAPVPPIRPDEQELYVEPDDNTNMPPLPPNRPQHTLPSADEDYIEPDVEMPPSMNKRTLPAIPTQTSKISSNKIGQPQKASDKAQLFTKKRGNIPPPPTTKISNGPRENCASPVHSRKPIPPPSQNKIESFPWYHGNTNRQIAEPKFKRFNTDGAFIVRDSVQQNQPYTLMVFKASETKVYNLPIRQRPEDKRFALGGSKKDEETFKTVPEMIEHFLKNTLIVGSGANQGEIRLSVPLPK